MHSPYTYYDPAPSFAGRGRRFFRQNYMRGGLNPRTGGIGGLLKVALVGTATYFVCKKIYHAGAQSKNNGQTSQSIKSILSGNEQTVIKEYERLRRRVWDLENAETFAVTGHDLVSEAVWLGFRKWACERLLESAAALELGLPVTIHRPCAVIGDEAPNKDALNALLKYSKLTRCVPRFENFEGYLDFDDVHRVAGAIAADALPTAEARGSKPAARFVHHSSGHKVSMKDFRGRMETLFECPFEEVSMAEWIERALQAGIDPLITGYLEAMTMKGETILFPFMGETESL
ncbi:hypothetical protein IFM58399_06803 [Aspergillus lentulus]|nr:uncharacterized protein IFM58399_06803 [Aspergillus lentulus]GFF43025.1 hypothetical protein IFM58399_06803 [Aspergillus lentulus]GFF77061.1 hypothetical protein IFM62136_09476 [Aspergillus lentulus]GFG08305.1 hypothetical protein IFM61392_05298 [Aspergillus lentulus]